MGCYLLTTHRFTLTRSQFASNGKWHCSRCPNAHGQASGLPAFYKLKQADKTSRCVYCLCVEKPTRVNWALKELGWSVRAEEQAESCPLERAHRPAFQVLIFIWPSVSRIELMAGSGVTPQEPQIHTHAPLCYLSAVGHAPLPWDARVEEQI